MQHDIKILSLCRTYRFCNIGWWFCFTFNNTLMQCRPDFFFLIFQKKVPGSYVNWSEDALLYVWEEEQHLSVLFCFVYQNCLWCLFRKMTPCWEIPFYPLQGIFWSFRSQSTTSPTSRARQLRSIAKWQETRGRPSVGWRTMPLWSRSRDG